MFCCCRILHFIKRYVLSAWYPKEPVVYQRLEGKLTIIKSVSLDRTITKYKIWDKDIQPKYLDPTEVTYILKSKVDAPWLWFGAESPVGRTDLTNCFEPYLFPGNRITPEFLETTYPLYYDWKYLDPKTFKEVDFPKTGIIIDAARVERSTKESQEDKTN
jgi:hypothetical protein